MNEFAKYHPLVNFIYFTAITVFSVIFMNPFCMVISLVCAFAYSIIQKGKKTLRACGVYCILFVLTALINPAFNHKGITILAYFPSGNPLTMESVIFGAAAACMVISVLIWLSCAIKVMDSDKLVYLFGRVAPSLALIFSMTLGFVPKFKKRLALVMAAQKGLNRRDGGNGVLKRAKVGLAVLSALISWMLESSITTADSMKSRGYGLPGRTSFSLYIMSARDRAVLACIICLTLYIAFGFGTLKFEFYPMLTPQPTTLYTISVFAAYTALCLLPIVAEVREELKWNSLLSKI